MGSTANAAGGQQVLGRDPFRVDEGNAADALRMVWGGLYDEIVCHGGVWTGRRDGIEVTGKTPDEFARNLRADQDALARGEL
jgi:hypothetical protein